MEILVQPIELLSVADGTSKTGEKTVVITVRPDKDSFRPHNLEISRTQAVRLFRNLRIILRQSAGLLLIGFIVASMAGCSGTMVFDKTVRAGTDLQGSPTVTEQRMAAAVDVELPDRAQPSPGASPSPSSMPGPTVEITGDANFVLVVDGDLSLGVPDGDRSSTPAKSWNTKIPWRTDLRGAGSRTVGCYLAVVFLVVASVALMLSNLSRERGGFLLVPLAMLVGAAILLQFLPHARSGLQVLPLPPSAYGGWLPVGISLLSWMAIAVAGYVAVSGCLDAPKVFAVACLFAMSLNALLSIFV